MRFGGGSFGLASKIQHQPNFRLLPRLLPMNEYLESSRGTRRCLISAIGRRSSSWLGSQPRELLLALAARAKLRILPFAQMARHDNYEDRLLLPLFRAATVSWASAIYAASEAEEPSVARAAEVVQAALAEPAIAGRLPSFLSLKIMLCHSARANHGVVWTALCAALGSSAGVAAALQWDGAAIAGGASIRDVLARKLWPKAKPRRVAQLWRKMKGISSPRTVTGRCGRSGTKHGCEAGPLPRLDLARLIIKNDIWEQGQAFVNHEIKELIARQGPGRRRMKLRVAVPTSGVPALCPAALEPAWVAGRLTLPRNAAESERESVVTEAAFKLLGAKVSALADQADFDPVISQRSVVCLQSVAARIPGSPPPQHELFYLAHVKGLLEEHAKIVEGEWQDALMRRFAETILHFDLLVRQFAKWRDFLAEAERNPMPPQEAAAIPALAMVMIAVLRKDEAQNFIDPAIPSALELFQAPLLSDMTGNPQISGPGEASKLLLAKDLFLSMENIAKRIAEAALDGRVGAASQIGAQASGPVHFWSARTLTKIETSTRPLGLQEKLCWLEPVAGFLDGNSQSSPKLLPLAGTRDQDGNPP